MPNLLKDSCNRSITASANLVCGDLVQLTDGTVGIVEAQRGIKTGETGNVNISGQVIVTKTTASDVIAAGARIAYHPTTKTCIAQVGAATNPAFIIGRAVAAAGNGVTTVTVDLNHQGATI